MLEIQDNKKTKLIYVDKYITHPVAPGSKKCNIKIKIHSLKIFIQEEAAL